MPQSARRAEAVSNAPSVEYRRHHKVEAPEISAREFRPGWRRIDTIERLALAGAISTAEYQAACVYRGLVETAALDALASPDLLRAAIARGQGGRPLVGIGERQAEAISRLGQISKAMGPVYCRIIVAVVVDSESWAALGKRWKCCPKTARRKAIGALVVLAAVMQAVKYTFRKTPGVRHHSGGNSTAFS